MPEQDWNSYLAELELANPTMAALLRQILGQGGLPDAVPPAGEYTTGIDYETLSTALSMEYVGEVIREYEATLGPAPELYEAAVANGWLTPDAAQGLQAEGFTRMGSLQTKFANQGGLRTLAGPYQAARTELLGKALADMEAAAQKASADAYTLAQQTTQLRIQALTNAGQLGLGLVNAGVNTRGSQRSLRAAEMGAEGPGERPPIELPRPPEPPTPSGDEWWQKLLAAGLGAGITGGLKMLGEPSAKTPEQVAQEKQRYADEVTRLNDPNRYDEAAREIVGRNPFQESYPTLTSMEPFGIEPSSPYGYGSSAMPGGGFGVSPYSDPYSDGGLTPPTSFDYQNIKIPSYNAPQGYSGGGGSASSYDPYAGYGEYSYPDYSSYDPYSGYGEYSYPDYGSYDYGTSYQGDYGYSDYDYGSYYPDYTSAYDYGGYAY